MQGDAKATAKMGPETSTSYRKHCSPSPRPNALLQIPFLDRSDSVCLSFPHYEHASPSPQRTLFPIRQSAIQALEEDVFELQVTFASYVEIAHVRRCDRSRTSGTLDVLSRRDASSKGSSRTEGMDRYVTNGGVVRIEEQKTLFV